MVIFHSYVSLPEGNHDEGDELILMIMMFFFDSNCPVRINMFFIFCIYRRHWRYIPCFHNPFDPPTSRTLERTSWYQKRSAKNTRFWGYEVMTPQ